MLGEPTFILLHKLHLRHHLINGEVTLGVIDHIPVPGVHLLLGNDLAGSKVFPQTVIDPWLTIEKEKDSELYRACAVTRSQTKLKPIPATEIPPTSSQSFEPPPSTMSSDPSKDPVINILSLNLPLNITHEDMVKAQHNDIELQSIMKE